MGIILENKVFWKFNFSWKLDNPYYLKMVLNWCDALMVVAMQYRKMQASSEVGFFYE